MTAGWNACQGQLHAPPLASPLLFHDRRRSKGRQRSASVLLWPPSVARWLKVRSLWLRTSRPVCHVRAFTCGRSKMLSRVIEPWRPHCFQNGCLFSSHASVFCSIKLASERQWLEIPATGCRGPLLAAVKAENVIVLSVYERERECKEGKGRCSDVLASVLGSWTSSA